MHTDIPQAPIGRSTSWGSSALGLLRQHPLWGYFLLAFAFTWVWLIPMFLFSHQQVLGPWLILCPTLAGFVMAARPSVRAGIIRLLRRALLWRVGLGWYLVALLLSPLVWLVSIVLTPGSIAAFRVPDWSFLVTYLSAFVAAFFSVLAIEEFGWRGFALPRLQERYGPLLGTFILSVARS
jgi:membrane protease YdiL (CAAX protease family)